MSRPKAHGVVDETFPFIFSQHKKPIHNYKTYIPNPTDVPPTYHESQTEQSLNRKTLKIPIVIIISILLASIILFFNYYTDYDDVTRIPKSYQLCRDNYDSFDYNIESSFFASKSNELTATQDIKIVNDGNLSSSNITYPHKTRAIINQIDKRLGEYQVQEFFYKNDSIAFYNSPITSVSYIESTWPIIVEISFTTKKSLEKAAIEACNFRIIFDKKGFFKDFDGYIERKCNRAWEHSFYLVSQVEGNTDSGLKFFHGKDVFATISNKLLNRELRDVLVHDRTPFPSLIPTLYAIYYDYFKMKRHARDITRIPNNYQLLRDEWNTYNYIIQSTSLISSNEINSTIQNLPSIRATIKAIEYPSGKYYVQEFFYESYIKDYSSITTNSVIQYKWPAIVEIYFTSSVDLLDPYSLEICNFKFAFFKEGYDKEIEGQVERRCPRAFESSFYLVSNVEGNSDLGFKFSNNGSEFATISPKSPYKEKRRQLLVRLDVVVEDEPPFPSLIPTLYAIYYDYFKMKRQARDITRIPNNYQLMRDKLHINNYVIQSDSFISPYNTPDDPSTTTRAIINAIKYPSGKYSVREYFYEVGAKDYSHTLITTNSKIQDQWPAIVEIDFTSLGKALDPYALEVCNFRLAFFKEDYNEDFKGHIERRCPKALESDFYLVSMVEGNSDEGFKFFQEGNEVATVSSKEQYREKRDIVVNDNSPFVSLIPGLYTIYYDYLKRKSHAQDITRIPKIYQLRWNSWYLYDYNYVIESKVYTHFAISDINELNTTNNNNISTNDENPLTIRATLNAAQYTSGYYEVKEFFYKLGSQDYFDTLITAKATIQSLLPGIVEISFITSDKVLDPYALEACEYKLIYFENFEGQIERRCKRAFEDDFYMVSQVSGSTYRGLQFTLGEDKSKLSASTSAVDYWPSLRRRDVMVYDDTPFPSIIPALYSVYYDYVAKNR
ncbi:20043_t:CDS:2 [Dentiscutata erythropus]|uniref:20043_t:CDS:1 n=1 Tax=Dentiscutata erythropus TaxID=1348616 RepID=A0A9N8ZNN3_9GLOM|nr:20043_t:CDS:2 [Dentiscutata erythropus]